MAPTTQPEIVGLARQLERQLGRRRRLTKQLTELTQVIRTTAKFIRDLSEPANFALPELPPRGPRGSAQNVERMLAVHAALNPRPPATAVAAALEAKWLRRVEAARDDYKAGVTGKATRRRRRRRRPRKKGR